MVRLRLQCVMSILLGSTGMLIAQQQQPLPQGRLPRTPPVPLTSTQPNNPNNPNTVPQHGPRLAAPEQGAQPIPAAQSGAKATPATVNTVAKPAVKGKPSGGKKTQEIVQAQPAPPPPPPPTLEQMPAQPPQVRFANGLLTVEAKNSTLSDVLTAIRRQTGASLEIPPGAGSERIMAHLGPGQPREVIVSLLNGSNFDYIILGSLQRPGGLDKIILSARQSQPSGGAPAAVAQNPGLRQPQQPVAEDSEGEGGDAPDREVDTASEPEPEQPQPEQPQAEQPQAEQPAQQAPGPQPGAPGQPAAQQQAQPEGEGQPQVKTPEQLLRELQQMRQQQQQQQQQQGEGAQPQDTPNQPPQ
jgi:hypothetical protein